jgi:hypothetical protein
VIYIGEERCSKLIPTWVISCIDYIYFQKVPQVGIHNMWMGGSTSTFWSIYIHLNNFLVPSMLCVCVCVCVYSFVEVWWIFLWTMNGFFCGRSRDWFVEIWWTHEIWWTLLWVGLHLQVSLHLLLSPFTSQVVVHIA